MSIREKLRKYGDSPTSHDLLKAVASISMVIDHIGLFFLGDAALFRVLGRLAAPMFFFLIGYAEKKTLEWRLFLWGLWLTALFVLVFQEYRLNILIVFLIFRWLLKEWDPAKASPLTLYGLFALTIPFYEQGILVLEYAQIGLFWAIAGRLVATKSKHKTPWIVLTSLATIFWSGWLFDLNEKPLWLSILLIAQFGVFALATIHYSKKNFPFPKIIALPTIFLSRLSLEIYILHLTAFLLFVLAFADL